MRRENKIAKTLPKKKRKDFLIRCKHRAPVRAWSKRNWLIRKKIIEMQIRKVNGGQAKHIMQREMLGMTLNMLNAELFFCDPEYKNRKWEGNHSTPKILLARPIIYPIRVPPIDA